MINIQVAQPLFDALNTASVKQMNSITDVMAGIGVLVGALWTLNIAIQSLYWYFNGISTVISEFLTTMFKASVIIFMAFTVSWYTSTIIPVVTEFPVWLGNTLSGTTQGGNLVDAVINSYLNTLVTLLKEFSFNPLAILDNIGVILQLIFYIGGGTPFILVTIGTLLTLKAATTLILVLGPMFIACLLFPHTRQYFFGWVSTLGGFVLTQALFASVIGLAMNILNPAMDDFSASISTSSSFKMFLWFLVFTKLATEIPMYAASIMGGAASSVGGVGGIMGKALGVGTAMNMSKGLGGRLKGLMNKNKVGAG